MCQNGEFKQGLKNYLRPTTRDPVDGSPIDPPLNLLKSDMAEVE